MFFSLHALVPLGREYPSNSMFPILRIAAMSSNTELISSAVNPIISIAFCNVHGIKKRGSDY